MAKMALELDADFMPVHRLLSMAYQGKGMFEEAIAENQRWGNRTGNKIKADIALAQIYATAGRKEEAREIIELSDLYKNMGGNDYRGVALVYASLGETDKTFEWLEKSCDRHEESLCSMNVDPKWDGIRSDPRFKKILKRINLAE
jgi:tetratricopeptide (TPR) repeat protein